MGDLVLKQREGKGGRETVRLVGCVQGRLPECREVGAVAQGGGDLSEVDIRWRR